jgi:ABC-type transport system involved in multi-copper enzyme maturation permease subunit
MTMTTTPTILRSLVRKDVRLNRNELILGVLAWLGPYALVVALMLLYEPPGAASAPSLAWRRSLAAGGFMSLVCTNFTAMLLGANAFALERSHRSAEFLAILPASRRQVVASKLIVALVPMAAFWALDAAVIAWLAWGSPGDAYLPALYAVIGAVTLMAFGVSWLASSLLDRPLTALAAPLLLGGLVFCGTSLLLRFVPSASRDAVVASAYVLLAALGAIGLAAGTWIALRRVEP